MAKDTVISKIKKGFNSAFGKAKEEEEEKSGISGGTKSSTAGVTNKSNATSFSNSGSTVNSVIKGAATKIQNKANEEASKAAIDTRAGNTSGISTNKIDARNFTSDPATANTLWEKDKERRGIASDTKSDFSNLRANSVRVFDKNIDLSKIISKHADSTFNQTVRASNAYLKGKELKQKFNEGWNNAERNLAGTNRLVGEDGKTAAGAHVGDVSYTDNGKYGITGVYSDASYQSDIEKEAFEKAKQALAVQAPGLDAKARKRIYQKVYYDTLYGEDNWSFDEKGNPVVKGMAQPLEENKELQTRDQLVEMNKNAGGTYFTPTNSELANEGRGNERKANAYTDYFLDKFSAGVSNMLKDDEKREQYTKDVSVELSHMNTSFTEARKTDANVGSERRGYVAKYEKDPYSAHGLTAYVRYMSEYEKREYDYLYDSQGKDVAKKYLEDMKYLKYEQMDYDTKVGAFSEPANTAQDKISQTVYSVWTQGTVDNVQGLVNTAKLVGNAAGVGEYKPVTGKTAADNISSAGSQARQSVVDSIDSQAGKLAYQTVMTTVDMLVATGEAALGGEMLGFVKGLGSAGKVGTTIGEIEALSAASKASVGKMTANLLKVAFYSKTAQQAIVDTLVNGGSQDQALALGFITGLEEVAAEYLPIGLFADGIIGNAGLGVKAVAKNFVKGMFAEGGEEAVTQVVQSLTDTIIRGNDSDYMKLVSAYQDQGLDYESAHRQASNDTFVWGAVEAAIVGAASGGGMGAGTTAIGTIVAGDEIRSDSGYARLLAEYAKTIGVSDKAQSIADKVIGQKKVRAWELAELKGAIQESAAEKLKTSMDEIAPKLDIDKKDKLALALAKHTGKDNYGYSSKTFTNAVHAKVNEMRELLHKYEDGDIDQEELDDLNAFETTVKALAASDYLSDSASAAVSAYLAYNNRLLHNTSAQPLGKNQRGAETIINDTEVPKAEMTTSEQAQTPQTAQNVARADLKSNTPYSGYTVGKVTQRSATYHKSAEAVQTSDLVERAKAAVASDSSYSNIADDYDVIDENKKSGIVTFTKYDDFDGSANPRPVRKIKVTKDGKIKEVPAKDFDTEVLANKSKLVSEDYTGFNVESQKENEAALKKDGYTESSLAEQANATVQAAEETTTPIAEDITEEPKATEETETPEAQEESEETVDEEQTEEQAEENIEEPQEDEESTETESEESEEANEEETEEDTEPVREIKPKSTLLTPSESSKVIATMGRNGKKVYDAKKNAGIKRQIATVYNEGRNLKNVKDEAAVLESFNDVLKRYGKQLSRADKAVLRKAYEAGIMDTSSILGNSVNKNSGLDTNSAGYSKAKKKLTRNQLNKIDAVGRALGVKIQFVEQFDPKTFGDDVNFGVDNRYAVNALNDNAGRTIQIRADAVDPLYFLIMHESIHRLRTVNPESYNKLTNYIKDKLTDQEFLDMIEAKGKLYKNLAESDLEEEVVANLMGSVLLNEDITLEFAKSHRNIVQQILDIIQSILDKITFKKRRHDSKLESMTDEEIEAINGLETDLKTLANMYQEALRAVYNTKTDESGATVSDDVQYSLRSLFSSWGFDVNTDTGELLVKLPGEKEYKPVNGSGIKLTREMLEKTQYGALINATDLTDEEKARQFQNAIDLYDLIVNTQMPQLVWRLLGTEMASAVTTNSDTQYNMTIDLGTICKKTQAILDVMSGQMVAKGRGLTKIEIYAAYLKVYKMTGQVPCGQCYVFSRWFGVGGYLETMYRMDKKYKNMSDERAVAASKRVNDLYGYSTDEKHAAAKAVSGKFSADRHKALFAAAMSGELNGEKLTKDEIEYCRDHKWYDYSFVKIRKASAKDKKSNITRSDNGKYVFEIDSKKLFIRKTSSKEDDKYADDDAKARDYIFNVENVPKLNGAYPKHMDYRNTRGNPAGKAIIPFTEMRFGELLQAMAAGSADKKVIQVGGRQVPWRKTKQVDPLRSNAQGELHDPKKLKVMIAEAMANTKWQNLLGGMRIHSTSDFRFDAALDYFMAFGELAAAKSFAQGYTKAPEELTWFCNAGIDTCLSLIGIGEGLDAEGNLIFSSEQGLDPVIAKFYRNEFANAQTIAIGMSDRHIEKMMSTDWIDQIIPWHASGNSFTRLNMMFAITDGIDAFAENCTNYELVQEDKELNRKQLIDYYGKLRDAKDPMFAKLTDDELEAAADKALKHRKIRQDIVSQFKETDTLSSEDKVYVESLANSEVETDRILYDLYRRFYVKGVDPAAYHAFMPSKQAALRMPYEYWIKGYDKDGRPTSVASEVVTPGTLGRAHENSQRFMDYARSLGLIPRFTGYIVEKGDIKRAESNGAEYGDFSKHGGYYKTLIDRSMYDLDGNYREQQVVNNTEFKTEYTYDTITTTSGEAKKGLSAKERKLFEERNYVLRQHVGLNEDQVRDVINDIDGDRLVEEFVNRRFKEIKPDKVDELEALKKSMKGAPLADVYRAAIDQEIIPEDKDDSVLDIWRDIIKDTKEERADEKAIVSEGLRDTSVQLSLNHKLQYVPTDLYDIWNNGDYYGSYLDAVDVNVGRKLLKEANDKIDDAKKKADELYKAYEEIEDTIKPEDEWSEIDWEFYNEYGLSPNEFNSDKEDAFEEYLEAKREYQKYADTIKKYSGAYQKALAKVKGSPIHKLGNLSMPKRAEEGAEYEYFAHSIWPDNERGHEYEDQKNLEYHSLKSYVAEMSPLEYMARCAAMFNSRSWDKSANQSLASVYISRAQYNEKNVLNLMEKMKNGVKMDMPWLVVDQGIHYDALFDYTKETYIHLGQEGLHRAVAAFNLGAEKIPVRYVYRDEPKKVKFYPEREAELFKEVLQPGTLTDDSVQYSLSGITGTDQSLVDIVSESKDKNGKPRLKFTPKYLDELLRANGLSQKAIERIGIAEKFKGKKIIDLDDLVDYFSEIEGIDEERGSNVNEYEAHRPDAEIWTPKETAHGKVSKHIDSIVQSDKVNNAIVPELIRDVNEGKFTYTARSNAVDLASAKKIFKDNGLEGAIAIFNDRVVSAGVPAADTIALGDLLIQEAAKEGYGETVARLTGQMASISSKLAQGMQALSLMHKGGGIAMRSYVETEVANVIANVQEENKLRKVRYKARVDRILKKREVKDEKTGVTKTNELTKQHRKRRDTLEDLGNAVEDVSSAAEDLGKAQDELKKAKADLKEAIRKSKEDEAAKRKLEQIGEERRKILDQLDEYEDQLSVCEGLVEGAEAEISDLKKQKSELSRKLKRLESQEVKKMAEIKALKSDISALEQFITKKEKLLEEAKAKKKDVQMEINALKRKLKILAKRTAGVKLKTKDLIDKLLDLETRVTEKKREHEEAIGYYRTAKSIFNQVQKRYAMIAQEIRYLDNSVDDVLDEFIQRFDFDEKPEENKPKESITEKVAKLLDKLEKDAKELGIDDFEAYKAEVLAQFETAEADLNLARAGSKEIAAAKRRLRSLNQRLADKVVNKGVSTFDQQAKVNQLIQNFDTDLMNKIKGIEEEKVSGKKPKRKLSEEMEALLENLGGRYSDDQFEEFRARVLDKARENEAILERLDAKRDQLRIAEKEIKKLNTKLSKIGYIEAPKHLMESLVNETDPDNIKQIQDEILTDIASQLRPTLAEKVQAWRFFRMLANFRTHLRNILGNTAMYMIREVKDTSAAMVEASVSKFANIERTKTLASHSPKAMREWNDFLKEEFSMMKDTLKGETEWDLLSALRDKKRIFETKPLQMAYRLNSDALEAEDAFFLMINYKPILRSYLVANGVTPDMLVDPTEETQKILDEAREYAILEAQKATFRNKNKFASVLSAASKSGFIPHLFVEALTPFKKTPLNVLGRGIEYSPLGFLDVGAMGAANVVSTVATGEAAYKTAKLIDKACAATTGTMLTVIGALMFIKGLIHVPDDDNDENSIRKLLGLQDYSITIGKKNITIDWLTPSSMPLFLGAEFVKTVMEIQNSEGDNVDLILNGLNAIASTPAPMYDMSMLSGFMNFLDEIKNSGKYDETNESTITTGFKYVAWNYISQILTSTFGGQVTRTMSEESLGTYADDNSHLSGSTQLIIQKMFNKQGFVSGMAKALEDSSVYRKSDLAKNIIDFININSGITYQDRYGETESEPSWLKRTIKNFIMPWYGEDIKDDPVADELLRLYDELGADEMDDASLKKMKHTIKSAKSGPEFKLHWNEYKPLEQQFGSEIHRAYKSVIASADYKELSDIQKRDVLKLMDSYYRNKACVDQLDEYIPYEIYDDVQENLADGVSVQESLIWNAVVGTFQSADDISTAKSAGLSMQKFSEVNAATKEYDSKVVKAFYVISNASSLGIKDEATAAIAGMYNSSNYSDTISSGDGKDLGLSKKGVYETAAANGVTTDLLTEYYSVKKENGLGDTKDDITAAVNLVTDDPTIQYWMKMVIKPNNDWNGSSKRKSKGSGSSSKGGGSSKKSNNIY